jgi:hypothetical protein
LCHSLPGWFLQERPGPGSFGSVGRRHWCSQDDRLEVMQLIERPLVLMPRPHRSWTVLLMDRLDALL